MANREDGVIKDQDENLRYDFGEAAKDTYEAADAYEKDKIELRGIVFFTVGLVLMIGVTFGLMALLQRAMEDQAKETYSKEVGPMSVTDEDLKKGIGLPPEPRLQAAPGFQAPNLKGGDPINLELREPQAEYRELKRQWNDIQQNGLKDPNTGTAITMPIEEAKKKVLESGAIKTRAAEQADKASQEVRLIPSYQSSGRATEIRRQ